jgi:hypothetical protein
MILFHSESTNFDTMDVRLSYTLTTPTPGVIAIETIIYTYQ